MGAEKKKQITREDIKKDLLSQLEKGNLAERFYLDLINDYMALWDIKNNLIDDVAERGVSVYWSNGGGQEGHKKNDSVSELTKVNTQMLKLLSDLGLKAGDKLKENGSDVFTDV